MVISRDDSAFRWRMAMRFAATRLVGGARFALIVCLVAAMAAVPAEAKKKRKRSHYSPPQAAMVVDFYSGKILYAQNIDAKRYPASVTKVMTLYLLFEQMRDGHMTRNTKLKVSAKAAARPPSKLGLKPGSTISVSDAMYALVTKSANDVAAVVAENIAGSEAAFARMMTQKARAIGMSKTTFRNASGLPNSAQVTTARDLITLGRRVLKDFPDEAKIFRTRYFEYKGRKYRNHNRLLFSYAGMDGLKTGFTRASGFNLLASCHRDDKHLLAVVLGGRSSRRRNARMRNSSERVLAKGGRLQRLETARWEQAARGRRHSPGRAHAGTQSGVPSQRFGGDAEACNCEGEQRAGRGKRRETASEAGAGRSCLRDGIEAGKRAGRGGGGGGRRSRSRSRAIPMPTSFRAMRPCSAPTTFRWDPISIPEPQRAGSPPWRKRLPAISTAMTR